MGRSMLLRVGIGRIRFDRRVQASSCIRSCAMQGQPRLPFSFLSAETAAISRHAEPSAAVRSRPQPSAAAS
jgi:hypothetical protein